MALARRGPARAGCRDDRQRAATEPTTTVARVSANYNTLPEDLPVPIDDGAADGLAGTALPDIALPSTLGGELSLSGFAASAGPVDQSAPTGAAPRLLVAYVYPMTGTPGEALPHGWDDIPGARGCTPQSCAYRDALAEFERLGAGLIGISAQTAAEQDEFAAREHIPYPLLSDDRLELAAALGLPPSRPTAAPSTDASPSSRRPGGS